MKRCKILLLIILFAIIAARTSTANTMHSKTAIDSLEKITFSAVNNELAQPGLDSNCLKLTILYKKLPLENQLESGMRLLSVAEQSQNDNPKIAVLELLANASYEKGDYSNSIEYYYRIYNLYKLKDDELNAARTLLNIGHNNYAECEYLKAMDYYERAQQIFKRKQYYRGIAESLKVIALIIGHWGEYDKALKYNKEALGFCKEVGDKTNMADIHFNMGRMYQELGDLVAAKNNFQNSLAIYKEIGEIALIVKVTCHIGDIFLSQGSHNRALEYYIQAELMGKNSGENQMNAEIAFNIGKAYNEKGDFEKALDYQRKALQLFNTTGNKKSLVEVYAQLGLIYFNLNHYNKSLYYLEKGYEIANSINYKFLLVNYCLKLSDVHAILGNYKKAYTYYIQYINGRNAINEKEYQFKTEELQAKYFLAIKQKEVDELKSADQLNREQIKNQKLIMVFIILFLFVSLIFSFLFRMRYVQNQKLNVKLAIQNKEIESQQEEMKKLNNNLQQANASKDRFFSIIAHDLKNPFNSLLGLSDLLIEDYQNLDENERKEFLGQIKSSGDKIYALLQNLLIWGRNQLGKIVPNAETFKLSELVNETIDITKQNAKSKNITISYQGIEEITVMADKNMISTVMLNLTTNAIKFTPQGGEIDICCFEHADVVEILVADTGVGISKENQQKLFKLDKKIQTPGTNNESGTGLGLILCSDFIEKNGGKLKLESEEGVGSWFSFTLPRKTLVI